MAEARAFYTRHVGGEIATGLSYGPDSTADNVEVDFNYDGDGKLYVSSDGVYERAEVSVREVRKFAQHLLRLADAADEWKPGVG